MVNRNNLKSNKKEIVIKKADLSDIFGLVKKRKMSGQKMKDLAREDWER